MTAQPAHGHVWELDAQGEPTLHDRWTPDEFSYHDIGYLCTACGLIFCCGCADNGDVEHCDFPASPTQETP